MAEKFLPHYAVEAEGHRIGISMCLECGAAILMGDSPISPFELHDKWHQTLDARDKELSK